MIALLLYCFQSKYQSFRWKARVLKSLNFKFFVVRTTLWTAFRKRIVKCQIKLLLHVYTVYCKAS